MSARLPLCALRRKFSSPSPGGRAGRGVQKSITAQRKAATALASRRGWASREFPAPSFAGLLGSARACLLVLQVLLLAMRAVRAKMCSRGLRCVPPIFCHDELGTRLGRPCHFWWPTTSRPACAGPSEETGSAYARTHAPRSCRRYRTATDCRPQAVGALIARRQKQSPLQLTSRVMQMASARFSARDPYRGHMLLEGPVKPHTWVLSRLCMLPASR